MNSPMEGSFLVDRDSSIPLKPPILELTEDELVQYLAQTVIYETEDVIAFDKPAGLPYSSGQGRLQIDRLLQPLKKIVAPNIDRLHLVESLDKCASGVLLFAKNADTCAMLRDQIKQGDVQHRFRVISRGIPREQSMVIDIPLYKWFNGSDMRYLPALKRRPEIFHVSSKCNTVNSNLTANVSLLDVFTTSANVHQVRSHLSHGINCPLIGEKKYSVHKVNSPVKLNEGVLAALGLEKNQSRNVPMFIHLAETLLPMKDGSRFSVVKAEIPALFLKVVKAVSLFRK